MSYYYVWLESITNLEMKVYRKRNSSKIKTLVITMACRKSKCGLAAIEHRQIKLSIVGIFVLMMTIVQCIGATGTYINSFIMISSYASLLRCFFFHKPKTREEIFFKNYFLEVIVNMWIFFLLWIHLFHEETLLCSKYLKCRRILLE